MSKTIQPRRADMKTLTHNQANLFITVHAQARMQQRSFSQTDIYAIVQCGTAISDKEILLTRRDAEREISCLRHCIKILQRRSNAARIQRCGTEAGETGNNTCTEISRLRQQIQTIDRLRNRIIVLHGNRVVTCYSCTKSKLKRISRIIN
jgi:hypothetical protein